MREASDRPIITNNNVTLTATFAPRLTQLLVWCALAARPAGCVSEALRYEATRGVGFVALL
jgi:hypothetical protein